MICGRSASALIVSVVSTTVAAGGVCADASADVSRRNPAASGASRQDVWMVMSPPLCKVVYTTIVGAASNDRRGAGRGTGKRRPRCVEKAVEPCDNGCTQRRAESVDLRVNAVVIVHDESMRFIARYDTYDQAELLRR